MSRDEFDLDRFVVAQECTYAQALSELTAGRKRSHWILYIFPQLDGLGLSPLSQAYGVRSLAEAQAYLAHPVLGPRLIECVHAMLGHAGASAQTILGEVDALKFRSCLTLFAAAGGVDPVFGQALKMFYDGQPDPQTIALLKQAGEAFAAINPPSINPP